MNGSKIKITHISYSGLGGHGNVLFNLIQADINSENTYEIIFYGIENVRIDYIKKCNELNIKYSYIEKKRGLDLSFFLRISKAIKETKTDILFSHGSYNIIPSYLNKLFGTTTKIITRETQANHLKTKSDWLFTYLGLIFSDKIVLLSDLYKEQILTKVKIDFIRKKIVVIPNALDIDKYVSLRNFNNIEEYKIGMVSRIVAIKDYETLIVAFNKTLKSESTISISLHIAGDGDLLPSLKKLVKDLDIEHHVHFYGLLNQNEIPDFLKSLTIYAHATYGETMSTSIMQAQASGLPIIASDVQGVNNVISHNKNGLLCEINNVDSYSQNLKLLLNDQPLLEKLSTESFKYAKDKLSLERMFNSYKCLFN
jgi:glycosyltransferase involved in cell wall biosynthesis